MEESISALQGHCVCGEVEFEIRGAPIDWVQCGCARCRRAGNSEYASVLIVERADFQWLRGESCVAEPHEREASHSSSAFCRRCGSDLPRVLQDLPVVVVPADSLTSEPAGMRPMTHQNVGSKAFAFEIADRLSKYTEVPPSV